MKPAKPIHSSLYVNSPARTSPPQELTETMEMPIPPAIATAQKEEVNRQQNL